MALGINDFSVKKTSLAEISKDGITEQDLQTFDVEDPKTLASENDDKLNHDELIKFIKAMGGKDIFTDDEAEALATWLLGKATLISISDVIGKLGGNDNVISADEIVLLGDVFAPSSLKGKTENDLDYLYNIFDANGILNKEELERLIGDIDAPSNVEKLKMTLTALGVKEAAITNIIEGLTSTNDNIKQGAVKFIENALKNPDTFVATMNKAEESTSAQLRTTGETAIATETPLTAKNPKEPTVAEFTQAISTKDNKIDKNKFAYVLVQMGLANDKETADQIVENIRKNNDIDYKNTTPKALVDKLDMVGGVKASISHTDLRIASYVNKDGVDLKAFEALLESSTDKTQIIKELYAKAGVKIDDKIVDSLAKLETKEIIAAIFGTATADRNGNIPLDKIRTKPTAPTGTIGETSNDDVKSFSEAVTTKDERIDATKLAEYLETKGVIDSDTTDAEAKLIAENIIKFNGGFDVTATELFGNMAGDKVVGNDYNQLTNDKIIASAFINQNNEVNISAFKAILDANSDKSKVIDALYNAIGVETPSTGKTSAELAKQSTDNIVKAVFGDTNGAETVTAQSVKAFVDGTAKNTGATATQAGADGSGNIVISNGIIEPDTFTAYITSTTKKDKIDTEKLTQALKLLGLDDTVIQNAVTAWGELTPSNITNLLEFDGKITKDTVVLASAFIDYKTGSKQGVIDTLAEDKSGVTDEHMNKHAVMSILTPFSEDDRSNFLQRLFIKLGISPEASRAFVIKLAIKDLAAIQSALEEIGLFSGNKLDIAKIQQNMEKYTAPATTTPAPAAPAKATATTTPAPATTTPAPAAPATTTPAAPKTIDDIMTALSNVKESDLAGSGAKGLDDYKSNLLQSILFNLGFSLDDVRPFVMQLDLNNEVTTKEALKKIGLFGSNKQETTKKMKDYKPEAPADITVTDPDNYGNFDAKLKYVTHRLKKIFNGTGDTKDYNASNPTQKFSADDGIGHTDISWDEVFKRLASMTKEDIDKFFATNSPTALIEKIKDEIRKKEYFRGDSTHNYKSQ